MESDDKLLKEDPRVKLIQLTELTKNYEAIIAKQRTLIQISCENERFGVLYSKEFELLETKAKIQVEKVE